MRVISNVERRSQLEFTLTLTLSRITGRGDRRATLVYFNRHQSADNFWMASGVLKRSRSEIDGAATLVANGEHFHRIVREGILQAKTSIDIMTADFKAMLVPEPVTRAAPSIVKHFRRLADRGVEIRLLHAGVPSSSALREMKQSLPSGLTIRRCPRLHTKAVILDCQRMYLGSANLTGAGLGAKSDGRRNFEMGIWTESPSLIDGVLEHFNELWEGHECEQCQRRDICPVPLEEPKL